MIASVLGNGLEWFDFLSYGLFAQLIASVFFPETAPSTSLILAFLVFAVGFVVRPLGGIVFGLYADRAGRKASLSAMMVIMAVGSLILALTPSYESIGVAAPLLVVVARILQGLSVGGEFAGSAVFLVEHAPPGRRMFYGSLQMCAQGVGILAASVFAFGLERSLAPDQLTEWGWRIPFYAGAIIGPVGLYLRWRIAETPEFTAQRKQKHKASLQHLPEQMPAILCGMGLVAAGTSVSYLWHSYLSVYAVRELHLTRTDAFVALSLSGIVGICVYPLAGWLGDRIGAFKVFFWGAGLYALLAWPLYSFIVASPDLWHLLIAEFIASVLLGAIIGCHPGLLAALFPVSVRSTGVGLSYNLSVLLFGGLAPATVTWLIAKTGSPMMPAIYQIVIVTLAIVLVGALGSVRRKAQRANAAAPPH
ncbi:MFS transporter [Brucella endophytica]|uniref:MFS transporter n=1 Tax=Brucella endophytica TaxID=1963359 RepID=UPI0016685E96|nr:MFS transporter [Brucella endophytica]